MRHALLWTLLLLVAPTLKAGEDQLERQGTRYRVYVTSPDRIELYWRGPEGKPFHQFRTLQAYLTDQGRKVRFLMNAGIFEEGGIPSGLLIANGKTENPINTSPGTGNFFLQPNGVFYVDPSGAHVCSTRDYQATAPEPRIAVQSGPLLLDQGKTHPVFRAASSSRLHRNGVGILPDGRVIFAITEFGQSRYPNLFEFADFFRAQGCRNALFLDGDISAMTVNPPGKLPPQNYFAAIFAVTSDQ